MNSTNSSELQYWNLVDVYSSYLEGFILTPIGILGILGNYITYFQEIFSVIIRHNKAYEDSNFLSLLGNVISIAVLTTKDLRNDFSDLLITLCTFDTTYLLTAICLRGAPKLSTYYNNNILPALMPFW